MRLGRSLFLSCCLLATAIVVPGACGTDGLVGGSCKTGLSLCENHCVDLQSNEANCGECGHSCDSGAVCVRGICGGGGEGWGGWGNDGSGGSGNHGIFAGNAGVWADAGEGGTSSGSEFDVVYPTGGAGGDACTPPYNTPARCGSCDTVCVNPTPVCGLSDSGEYACQARCESPLTDCSGSCVDLTSNASHCGTCGNLCPSGICYESTCVGEQAGHLVSLCMNLRAATQYSQATTLLGNAVFLTTADPAKILAYAQYANEDVVTRVRSALNWAASARGRSYRILTVTDPDEVVSRLDKTNFDVFLIYDQPNAPSGTLGTYGSLWTDSIDRFSREGGVSVVLDGNTGIREMSDLLTNAGILQTSGQSTVSGEQVYVRDFGDVMGANIVSPFLAPADSCVFAGVPNTSEDTSWIVTDNPDDAADRLPLSVHRFIDVVQ